jgi:hypothetical protein
VKSTIASGVEQMRHRQWRVYSKTLFPVTHFLKDATDSGAFASRHWQWRAAIRRFKFFITLIINNMIITIII